ncbi:MAG: RidA family protein [Albidovulum sp.]|nr:RidA family protein [Albidovulum sp.]
MTEITQYGAATNIPLSPALRAGNLIFVSGQVPVDDDGAVVEGIEAQTRLVLEKVRDLLAEAGGSMDRVVKTTVFLTDKEDFAAMNKVYSEFFPGTPPTRSTIRCELMIDIKVEIEAIAAL